MYSDHSLDSTEKLIVIAEIIQINRNKPGLPVMTVNDIRSEIQKWQCT